ncbi:MAG: signal peptide peptidase SppA [Alphaproteobacteria bacterium]|nr:MAG: signal peptide peptidase SppA [Alphaproteobacteria bacterium]
MKKFFKYIGKAILGFSTVIGFLVLCLIIVGVSSFQDAFDEMDDIAPLPSEMTLMYDMQGALPEMNSTSYFDHVFGSGEASLYNFLRVLAVAKDDTHVEAFTVFISDGDYSLTQLQAMRNAVLDFRTSGKLATIYTSSFGDFSNGMAEYWFASAFDTIIVQPIGNVSLNGIYIEQPYAKEALDKIGVEPQILQRKSYKTAPETYLRSGMSEESKETLVAIAEGFMEVMVKDIATARGLEIVDVARAIHESPMSVEQALDAKLIDSVLHFDEVENGFIHFPEVSVARYAQHLPSDNGDSEIAYVPVNGMILSEEPAIKSAFPMAFVLPDDIAKANDIAETIIDAANDDDIKVILLSINSPGGSPTASETIRRAVVYARENDKYVIAAMGDVAASGGYWIATHANQIIASDLTITGSIGVYGGKMNIEGLWDKIGINWDAVKIGNNAGLWSMNAPYSNAERARISAMMDNIYAQFTSRVSDGRNLSVEQVEKIAQGRAWMGRAAQEKGLVDLNGAFDFALKRAASEAGGLDWTRASFLNFEGPRDPLDEIMEMIGIKITGGGVKIPTALLPAIIPQAVVTAPVLEMQF